MTTLTATSVRAGDDRKPVTWLNYASNVLASIAETIDSGAPMGPNANGELLWPVCADYDAAANSRPASGSPTSPRRCSRERPVRGRPRRRRLACPLPRPQRTHRLGHRDVHPPPGRPHRHHGPHPTPVDAALTAVGVRSIAGKVPPIEVRDVDERTGAGR